MLDVVGGRPPDGSLSLVDMGKCLRFVEEFRPR
jgi:hypothetical protein